MNSTAAEPGLSGMCFQPDTDWNRHLATVSLGPTHGGLACSREGYIICTTDGPRSTVLLDETGRLVRQLAPSLSGIHAVSLMEEDGQEFLLCAHLTQNRVLKMDLNGGIVWTIDCPLDSGFYDSHTDFKPTAAVQAPDGRIFVADGYGASVVHIFDSSLRYVGSFGGADAGPGQLCNCHGMALDTRDSRAALLICDRRNRRLVRYSLEGEFLGTLASDMRRPCSVAFGDGGIVAVAELEGRVLVLNENRNVLAVCGDNPNQAQWANYDIPASAWDERFFNAPHAVCFDQAGNLYVQEWSAAGRLTRWTVVKASEDAATKTKQLTQFNSPKTAGSNKQSVTPNAGQLTS